MVRFNEFLGLRRSVLHRSCSTCRLPGYQFTQTGNATLIYHKLLFIRLLSFPDTLAFNQFFRTWLQDNGSDDVHLLVNFDCFDDNNDGMYTLMVDNFAGRNFQGFVNFLAIREN